MTPAVVLSELQISGTPGDLNGDGSLNEADRTALMNAIAAPPVSNYDLLGGPQNSFDLNADDAIDSLDLTTFNTFFLPPVGLAGDFNGDHVVDAADYTVWRDHLGAADESSLNGNGDGMNGVDAGDYSLWKTSFGTHSGAGAGGLAAGAVPEPGTVLLGVFSLLGLVGLRRRGV